ncbi:hypothetical protein BDN70DRAFT_828079, partial [Pholiota conissans]
PSIGIWTSTLGRIIIREIVEVRIPQWPTDPHDSHVDCWTHSLQGILTLLIASTGWGKIATFLGPILVLQHLLQYPNPAIRNIPPKPGALIVTPFIELGNAHAREISQLGLRVVTFSAETLTEASDNG